MSKKCRIAGGDVSVVGGIHMISLIDQEDRRNRTRSFYDPSTSHSLVETRAFAGKQSLGSEECGSSPQGGCRLVEKESHDASSSPRHEGSVSPSCLVLWWWGGGGRDMFLCDAHLFNFFPLTIQIYFFQMQRENSLVHKVLVCFAWCAIAARDSSYNVFFLAQGKCNANESIDQTQRKRTQWAAESCSYPTIFFCECSPASFRFIFPKKNPISFSPLRTDNSFCHPLFFSFCVW